MDAKRIRAISLAANYRKSLRNTAEVSESEHKWRCKPSPALPRAKLLGSLFSLILLAQAGGLALDFTGHSLHKPNGAIIGRADIVGETFVEWFLRVFGVLPPAPPPPPPPPPPEEGGDGW